MKLRLLAPLAAALWTASFSALGLAQSPCEPPVARLVSAQGKVEARADAASAWKTAALNDVLCPGYMIRVGEQSRAALLLSNDTVLRLDQHTTLTFSGVENREISWLDLISGIAHFISRVPRALKVKTPFVNAAVEGTEFVVTVAGNEASVTVFEGRVWAENEAGRLVLDSGQTAVAQAGQAPVARVVVRPRDAVQWALYYPPLLDRRLAATPAFMKSFKAYYTGDVAGAIAALDVPGVTTDARLLVHRAALRLVVGRVDEARADVARAQALDPRNVHALALQSIIALLQNDKDRALALAREATTQDPQSTPALIALSYAQQAVFDIEGATKSTEQALVADPDDTYARARLAELRLSLGDLDGALAAAQRAVETDTHSARAHTVLGFAHLTRIDIAEARHAFEQAIERDSADPLPRLGLGIAIIRTGDLKTGRREIEIAASLDPNNSLIRSYLGKAYYEEKRDRLAGSQLAMAKALDDKDPTPWFYDAIRKQTENRPVEALHDLQTSIELNDNRAVYRSRLLLDGDLAARSASLGRIYRDLGFEQLALVEGWKSVNIDPSNHSAHRFLADSYSALPRHEIARVSELLQSQLLQPLNVTPLQPQLGESDLFILSGAGPSDPASNELNPLFARNRVAFQFNGIVGSNDTASEDLVLSGIQNQWSYSIGQFYYKTNGFRENNDLEHEIYDGFFQISLSPKSSLQAEIRSRDTDNGDLNFRFDPADFFPNDRRKTASDFARFGYHYAPAPRSDFLVSLIYQDLADQSFIERFPAPTVKVEADQDGEFDGHTAEVQYLFRRESLNLTMGAGGFRQKGSSKIIARTSLGGIPLLTTTVDVDLDRDHDNVYFYSNIRATPNTTWTLGVSYDDFTNGDTNPSTSKDRFNPKLGLIWDVTRSTTLRFAAFKSLKRALLSNQTLEPTQVAGFNQFFDDLNGSETKRYGAAIDRTFTKNLYGGIELTRRDLEVPQTPPPEGEEQEEQFHRAYLYWTPLLQLAFRAEYQYDAFDRNVPRASEPTELKTQLIPLRVGYYATSRLFASLIGTYAKQNAELAISTGGSGFQAVKNDSRFWVVDAELGYRFPKRRGTIGVLVKNILKEEFEFQDRNFQTTQPGIPMFVPERMIFFKFALSF